MARSRGETLVQSGRRVAAPAQQESAMLRRAATRSRGLHPGTCGHWRATSRCVALSYSAYRPPRNSAATVYQPHNGQTVRVVPINRPEPRSVEDIVKYGVPGVGISRGEGGRSMSPALSVIRFVVSCLLMHESDLFNASCFSDASDVSSTVGGVMVGKTLVMVDMMLQNLVTRVTYRVMSAAPISIIIPKVRL